MRLIWHKHTGRDDDGRFIRYFLENEDSHRVYGYVEPPGEPNIFCVISNCYSKSDLDRFTDEDTAKNQLIADAMEYEQRQVTKLNEAHVVPEKAAEVPIVAVQEK